MSGHHPWSILRDKLYANRPEFRAQVEAEVRAHRDATNLAEIRKARSVRQVDVARALKRTQSNISRVEGAEDHYIETLRDYVKALGGEVVILIEFPDQVIQLLPPVRPALPLLEVTS